MANGGKSPRRKGSEFERELCRIARESGLDAARAYASNGQSLGQAATVDCVIAGRCVQAKRRKSLPAYLAIPPGCDVVAFRQDHGPPLVLLNYFDWLDMCREAQAGALDLH
jgi:Holliday junction resolvase